MGVGQEEFHEIHELPRPGKVICPGPRPLGQNDMPPLPDVRATKGPPPAPTHVTCMQQIIEE